MKEIKVFGFPSHVTKERTGGVDFARVVQPMKNLDGFEYESYKFKVELFDPAITGAITKPEKILNYWVEVMGRNDILFLNYTTDPWGFAPMGAVARHFNKKIILDVDDNLWNVQKDNPVYEAFSKGSPAIKNFTAICNEVDYVTTTNLYLKHAISHNSKKTHDRIFIAPNYIDLDTMYTHRSKFKDSDQITLLHHGSTTHFQDLSTKEFEKGIDMVMKRYPNVDLKTVGAFLPEYKQKWGARYSNAYGDSNVYKWVKEVMPTYMDNMDILVVPLDENPYTRCKSSIKYIETSSYKKPGVYQKIRQYEEAIEDGVNGFLADTAKGWFEAISAMVEDKEIRRIVGENAYNDVADNWQIKNNLDKYASVFIHALNNEL